MVVGNIHQSYQFLEGNYGSERLWFQVTHGVTQGKDSLGFYSRIQTWLWMMPKVMISSKTLYWLLRKPLQMLQRCLLTWWCGTGPGFPARRNKWTARGWCTPGRIFWKRGRAPRVCSWRWWATRRRPSWWWSRACPRHSCHGHSARSTGRRRRWAATPWVRGCRRPARCPRAWKAAMSCRWLGHLPRRCRYAGRWGPSPWRGCCPQDPTPAPAVAIEMQHKAFDTNISIYKT